MENNFFNREPIKVAQDLIGKVLHVYHEKIRLSAQIIETEAYYKNEKSSHSYLGFTEKRKALFMRPGTIYMYYARGADSLNISCRGPGNAVLIKSGMPYPHAEHYHQMLAMMQQLNPAKNKQLLRDPQYLCSGQTLICKSLGLKVIDWNQKQFAFNKFYIEDCNYYPENLIQARRMGIPKGRDEHLLYRWIDATYANFSTENPLRKRNWKPAIDYCLIEKKIHHNKRG